MIATRETRKPLAPTLRWQHPNNPLPVRAVRQPAGSPIRTVGLEAPPWHTSGPADRPFDFCGAVGRLCADIARRCPELAHIEVPRLLIGMTQARSGQRHGLQARVTPLRFRDGRRIAGTATRVTACSATSSMAGKCSTS